MSSDLKPGSQLHDTQSFEPIGPIKRGLGVYVDAKCSIIAVLWVLGHFLAYFWGFRYIGPKPKILNCYSIGLQRRRKEANARKRLSCGPSRRAEPH